MHTQCPWFNFGCSEALWIQLWIQLCIQCSVYSDPSQCYRTRSDSASACSVSPCTVSPNSISSTVYALTVAYTRSWPLAFCAAALCGHFSGQKVFRKTFLLTSHFSSFVFQCLRRVHASDFCRIILAIRNLHCLLIFSKFLLKVFSKFFSKVHVPIGVNAEKGPNSRHWIRLEVYI